MTELITALKMFLGMTLLTGIVYPLLITMLAQGTMKLKADGEILEVKGSAVGARLVAQKFTEAKYFWARPSAVDYNPLPSGGSNLGPTSAALKKVVEERRAAIAKAHPVDQIPSEMLYASGSGLDPHITPAAALFQVDRIVQTRGLDPQGKEKLLALIKSQEEGGILGPPHLNVLELNLAVDEMFH